MLQGYNLLLQKRHFQNVLRIIAISALIMLLYFGLMAYSDDEKLLSELRNTNVGNLLVWSFWWPLIIIAAIFFGRLWCMVCPVELITSVSAKLGLKRKRPAWVLSGWMITLFYTVILFVGVRVFSIHKNPASMAVYLFFLVGVAIVTGLIYEKNTFCRFFCPVGYLLGLFSRLSFLGLRVKKTSVCDECKDKSCIRKTFRYDLDSKSCGVDIYPAQIENNSDCILCSGCIKTCIQNREAGNAGRPNPSIVRMGFASDLYKIHPLTKPEFVFLFLFSGLVVHELVEKYELAEELAGLLPGYFIRVLEIESKTASALVGSVFYFVLFPLVFWMVPYLFSRAAGLKISLKSFFLNYGLAFIPLVAAAHIAGSIYEIASGLPYFEHIVNDPAGVLSAGKIINGQLGLWTIPRWVSLLLSGIVLFVLAAGFFYSSKTVAKANAKLFSGNGKSNSLYFIPVVFTMVLFATIIFWQF